MIFARDLVEFFQRHTLHGNVALAGKAEQSCRRVAAKIFLYVEFVNCLAGLDGFEHGMYAKNVFGAVHDSFCIILFNMYAAGSGKQ